MARRPFPLRSTMAVLVLAACFAPLGHAQAPVPVPLQDDAGTGGDAPDTFESALRIPSIASFDGTLSTSPQGAMLGAHVGDRDDWFAFDVDKGQKVSVWLNYSSPVNDRSTLGQIVTPKGVIAVEFIPGLLDPVWLFADKKGEWRLRVFTDGPGSTYHVDVTVRHDDGFSGGASNPSYALMSFDVGPGGMIWGQFSLTSVTTRTVSSAASSYVLSDQAIGGAAVRTITVADTHVRVAGQALTVSNDHETAEGSDTLHAGWTPSGAMPDVLIVNGDFTTGRVHLLVFHTGDHGYFNYNLTLEGNVSYVGMSIGRPGDLVARLLEDHQGDVSVHTAAADASLNLSTTVDAKRNRLLVGFYYCDFSFVAGAHECSVTGPGSPTQTFTVGKTIVDQGAGTWTFTRNRDAAAIPGDSVLFHGVHVRLP